MSFKKIKDAQRRAVEKLLRKNVADLIVEISDVLKKLKRLERRYARKSHPKTRRHRKSRR